MKYFVYYPNCNTDGHGHSARGWMEYTRSTDGGKTFSVAEPFPYSKNLYDLNVGYTSMNEKAVRAPDGSIILFNLICDVTKTPQWEPYMRPTYLRSTDNGYTWGDAKIFCPHRGRIYDVQVIGERIYVLFSGGWNDAEKNNRFFMYVSEDNGVTFTEHSRLPFAMGTMERFYGTMEQLADGSLIVYTYNPNDEFRLDYELIALMGDNTKWADSYKLTADIDLTGLTQNGIGDSTTPFSGTFDGDGHTVKGLNVTNGLFGVISGATVKNLTVEGAVNATTANAGGIVGFISNNGTVENCVNKAKIISTSNQVGGIVGRVTGVGASGVVEIIDCVNMADIDGVSNAAGIVGRFDLGGDGKNGTYNVKNCANYGTITAKEVSGGIIGLYSNNAIGCTSYIENNLNAGNVVATGEIIAGISGYFRVYEQSMTVVIRNNMNVGNVSTTGSGMNIGGIIGVGNAKAGAYGSYVISVQALETYNYAAEVIETASISAEVTVTETEAVAGDVNMDGSVTIQDVLIVIRAVLNNQTIENGDLNDDGKLSLIDVIRVMKIVAGDVSGDNVEKEVITVACVGDSITQGTGSTDASKYSYPAKLQQLLGDGYEVINCGKASSYVMDVDSQYNAKSGTPENWYPNTAAYTKLKNSNPDIIIVMLGTNDARSMTEPAAIDDFVSAYKTLIADFASMESNPKIYLSSMIPATGAGITNQATVSVLPEVIEGIADELGLPFIPTHDTLHDYYYVMLDYNDKVHPNDDSYPALAANFYNEVFSNTVELPALPVAQGNVVYVSDTGERTNDGTSSETAVDNLGLAIAMLRETGGTVVVSGELTVKETHLVECADNVTVTSVWGAVDYRETNGAKLLVGGGITLASELTFENLSIETTASGKSLNCNYNNFTVADGVTCAGVGNMAIIGGFSIATGAFDAEEVSCHEDCTISVASGTWSLLRGGNLRTANIHPIGTVAKGVTLTVNISGGTFTYSGVNATTAVGMNGCDGDVYFNISGGEFTGGVYGIHRTGTNSTDTSVSFSGNIYMNITGGTFGKTVGLYHTADTPTVEGKAVITVKKDLESFVNFDGFAETNIVE